MQRSLEWWKSDEARNARLAKYVSHLLWLIPENRRVEFGNAEPEWPAIFHYDMATDLPYWVECKIRTHARDYLWGCDPSHINAAARQLAA